MQLSKKILLLIAVLLGCKNIWAQPKTNYVSKKISLTTDTITLDTLSIIPSTFSILNIAPNSYTLNFAKAQLIFTQKPTVESAWVSYRTFNYKLTNYLNLYNYDSVKYNALLSPVYSNNGTENKGIFDLGAMEYTGSFGRGISFGNAQDAVLNSNLNLQLNGLIGDSIQMTALLSDQNLPIQPDGSTAQLNEIDRVFLQFKKEKWNLNIGDIDLRQNKQYYLNFYKRLQGLTFENTIAITKKITTTTLVSGAIAKGKFATNQFFGLEGNQGPYRLQGANNELFFIVLANAERVYIDGELLQRGEDQDYIINYNTAEITFTPQKLITKDKRIRVEFEYSDRNYLNSQVYFNNTTTLGKKLTVTLAGFTNSDAKNSPINQTLNNAQRLFLSNQGDSVATAFFPTVIIDTLKPGIILYKRKDTVVNAVLIQIYQYSTNADSAKYNLAFSEVGQGKGNYVVLQNGANGKVFVWIKPLNGILQGTYEPVQLLIAPKKQQLLSSSITYQPNGNHTFITDLAVSVIDVNRFSKKDKGNDAGLAARVTWEYKKLLKKKIEINTNLAYESNNQNFKALERLRTPEFNRDWNLPAVPTIAAEKLSNASVQLRHSNGNSITLVNNTYTRNNGYKGVRQSIASTTMYKGWLLTTYTSYTATADSTLKGSYLRPTINLSKTLTKFGNYAIGANYFSENNTLLAIQPDTLNLQSIAFNSSKIYIQSNPTKDNNWGLSYIKRYNKIPVINKLLQSDVSDDIEGQLALRSNPHHKLIVRATYRNLLVNLPTKVTYQSDKTLLGRAEYETNIWRGLLTGSVLFETGSGQEQKKEFAYLAVPTGQGEYYWIDYNNNNVQEINEFETAQFQDQRKYIRIFLPTNQFIKANFNTFNYGMIINPSTWLNKKNYKGIKNIISRLYLQSSLQINKKEQSIAAVNINPFKYQIENNNLITLNTAYTNSASFNKFSNKWGIDINQDQRSNKALLNFGYESRTVSSYSGKIRYSYKQKLLLEHAAKKVESLLLTPSFNNRNYDVDAVINETKLSYTNKSIYRIATFVQYDVKQNRAQYGGEKAVVNSVGIEGKYNALQSAAINGRVSLSNINYIGNVNTAVSYIMLDALVPGKNYLWSIDLIKTLKNNIEITLRYEGRKTGLLAPIHIGSATMRANFY